MCARVLITAEAVHHSVPMNARLAVGLRPYPWRYGHGDLTPTRQGASGREGEIERERGRSAGRGRRVHEDAPELIHSGAKAVVAWPRWGGRDVVFASSP
jgi:hypothetical protein